MTRALCLLLIALALAAGAVAQSDDAPSVELAGVADFDDYPTVGSDPTIPRSRWSARM